MIPKLIQISGPIGVGKTTVASAIKRELEAQNLTCVALPEMSKELMEKLKDDVTGDGRKKLVFQTLTTLQRYIQTDSALQEKADVVIVDQGMWAGMVFAAFNVLYNHYGWGVGAAMTELIDSYEAALPPPFLTLWLDAEPEVLRKRVKKRGREAEKAYDKYQLTLLVQLYRSVFRAKLGDFDDKHQHLVYIDASSDLERVVLSAVRVVTSRLGAVPPNPQGEKAPVLHRKEAIQKELPSIFDVLGEFPAQVTGHILRALRVDNADGRYDRTQLVRAVIVPEESEVVELED